jgi:preprotein translocase subunit SecD
MSRETIRFEVRLAESHTAAGLREARVVGSNRLVYLHQDAIVSDADVSRGRVVQGDGPSRFSVALEFTPAGAEKMRLATSRHLGAPLAMLVNGDVAAAPVLVGPMSTSVAIGGDYTRAEAERLANGIGSR